MPSSAATRVQSSSQSRAAVGVAGQEDDADAVAAGGGQGDAELVALLGQEAVRHLQEDAGAVAGVLLAAAGAAVLQVEQHLHALLDDGVRLAAVRSTTKPTPQASCSCDGS